MLSDQPRQIGVYQIEVVTVESQRSADAISGRNVTRYSNCCHYVTMLALSRYGYGG